MTKSPSSIHLGTTTSNKQPFWLPLAMVTDSTAILGRKGSGKSTTARTLVEGMIECHVPTVIIDPLDVWWGLRASAEGKHDGLDVVIFGGSHADLPLTEGGASYIASLVVEKGVNAVLVLDEMKQAAQRRFVADFIERLFELKRPQEHRTPLHIVLDEADVFAPQKPMTPDAIRSQSVVDRMVRHGRSRGMGSTVITQRSSVLSKDVLTQTEVLIAMQVTSPQDRKALKEWTDAKATAEEGAAFKESIASMEQGEAWVWSPVLLKCFTRIKVDLPWTYDSSFTPTMNAKKPPAAKIKDLDLTAIKEAMATTIEQAKANDPKELIKQIHFLKASLATERTAKAAATPAVDPVKLQALVDKAVLKAAKDRDAQWRSKWDEHHRKIRDVLAGRGYPDLDDDMELAATLQAHVQRVVDHHTILGPGSRPPLPDPLAVTRKVTELLHADQRKTRANEESWEQRANRGGRVAVGDRATIESAGTALSGPERTILTVLAQHSEHHNSDAMPNERCAIRAGYSYSGSFRTYLSGLRTRSLIMNGSGGIYITVDGLKALGSYDRMPTGAALFDWWKARVSGPEAKILTALEKQGGMMGTALAEAAGYDFSGSFRTYLSGLRTKGLIVGRGIERINLHEDLVG